MTKYQYKRFVEERLKAEDKIIRDLIRKSPTEPLRRQNRCKGRTKGGKVWVEGKGLVDVKYEMF